MSYRRAASQITFPISTPRRPPTTWPRLPQGRAPRSHQRASVRARDDEQSVTAEPAPRPPVHCYAQRSPTAARAMPSGRDTPRSAPAAPARAAAAAPQTTESGVATRRADPATRVTPARRRPAQKSDPQKTHAPPVHGAAPRSSSHRRCTPQPPRRASSRVTMPSAPARRPWPAPVAMAKARWSA